MFRFPSAMAMQRLGSLVEAFFCSISDVTIAPADDHPVCALCFRELRKAYLTAGTLDGHTITFCNIQCCYQYCERKGQHWKKQAWPGTTQGGSSCRLGSEPTHTVLSRSIGPAICRLPGCNKPCYVEGTKVHDYCGRTHARQAGAMGAAASTKGGGYHGHGGGGRSTAYSRQYSGGSAHTSTSEYSCALHQTVE